MGSSDDVILRGSRPVSFRQNYPQTCILRVIFVAILNILKHEWWMNISGREMPTNKTTKAPFQRITSQQVDGGGTANDGEVAGANLVAVVAAETTAKVAAVMEEKMSMISNKPDIITAKLESEGSSH